MTRVQYHRELQPYQVISHIKNLQTAERDRFILLLLELLSAESKLVASAVNNQHAYSVLAGFIFSTEVHCVAK